MVHLEEEARLSTSKLWQYQRKFYQQEGIRAWSGQIPFYITSNPYIANSYANIIIRFIQDCVNNNHYNPDEPFYIIELGAGSGCFSFYTIKRLLELRTTLQLEQVSFVYVMSDFVEKNIDYWREHPAFKEYLRAGCVDFALFDIEHDTEIRLTFSPVVLRPAAASPLNPLLVLANYVFDSLPQDVFYIKDGTLQEMLLTLSLEQDAIEEDAPIRLAQASSWFTYKDVEPPYYQHKALDALLGMYQRILDDHYLLYPLGPLRSIQNLTDISGGQLCLIASDKGFSRHFGKHQKAKPSFVFHSDYCFSMMVNFHAIGEYLKQAGGDCFHQFTEQSLNTSVFLAGLQFSTMPETKLAADTYLDAFGHATVYKLYEHIETTRTWSSVETLLPFLATTRWDPHVFNHSLDIIINQLRSGHVQGSDIQDMATMVEQIADNFYYLPNMIDTLFNVGLFYQEIGEYSNALKYYEKSLTFFGNVETTLYNMGLCYYFLREAHKALTMFQAALKQNPRYVMARGWISQIEFETGVDGPSEDI